MSTAPTLDNDALPSLDGDPRWALVSRVRKGPLQNSPRLQQLLVYLAERAMRDPDAHVSEEQIGVGLFGRSEGYDTSVDTIVRVQISHLRRKLDHHFVAEGRDEPVVIELPKGSYVPVFRSRRPEAGPWSAAGAPESTPAAQGSGAASRWWRAAWPGLAGVLVLACAALLVDNVRLRRAANTVDAPHVAAFWRQFLANGRATHVVLSDTSLGMIADLQRRPVTLDDFRRSSYPWALTRPLELPADARALIDHAAGKGYTTPSDARSAHEIAALCQRFGVEPKAGVKIVSSRDLPLERGADDNLVLLGSRRASPWMEPFDEALTFRYRFEETRRLASIVKTSPDSKEEAVYSVDWGHRSYCVLAFLKVQGGHVLLLSGGDYLAAGAGAQFFADEPAMAGLYARLGIGLSSPVPTFEALIEADLAGYRLIGQRIIGH
jgi:hypothetical protein